MKIKLKGYKCERCNHKWIPRKNNKKPVVCPKCKSPYWDRKKFMDNDTLPYPKG